MLLRKLNKALKGVVDLVRSDAVSYRRNGVALSLGPFCNAHLGAELRDRPRRPSLVQAFVIAAEDEYLVLRKGFSPSRGHPVFIERVDVRFVVVVCSLFCAERYALPE